MEKIPLAEAETIFNNMSPVLQWALVIAVSAVAAGYLIFLGYLVWREYTISKTIQNLNDQISKCKDVTRDCETNLNNFAEEREFRHKNEETVHHKLSVLESKMDEMSEIHKIGMFSKFINVDLWRISHTENTELKFGATDANETYIDFMLMGLDKIKGHMDEHKKTNLTKSIETNGEKRAVIPLEEAIEFLNMGIDIIKSSDSTMRMKATVKDEIFISEFYNYIGVANKRIGTIESCIDAIENYNAAIKSHPNSEKPHFNKSIIFALVSQSIRLGDINFEDLSPLERLPTSNSLDQFLKDPSSNSTLENPPKITSNDVVMDYCIEEFIFNLEKSIFLKKSNVFLALSDPDIADVRNIMRAIKDTRLEDIIRGGAIISHGCNAYSILDIGHSHENGVWASE